MLFADCVCVGSVLFEGDFAERPRACVSGGIWCDYQCFRIWQRNVDRIHIIRTGFPRDLKNKFIRSLRNRTGDLFGYSRQCSACLVVIRECEIVCISIGWILTEYIRLTEIYDLILCFTFFHCEFDAVGCAVIGAVRIRAGSFLYVIAVGSIYYKGDLTG